MQILWPQLQLKFTMWPSLGHPCSNTSISKPAHTHRAIVCTELAYVSNIFLFSYIIILGLGFKLVIKLNDFI